MRIFVASLGCPKNTVDTERMLGYAQQITQIEIVNKPQDAEVILINTCGFITPAKEESVDAILEAIEIKKANPQVKLVVAGCLYERYKSELKKEFKEVDAFVGVHELERITEALTPSHKIDRLEVTQRYRLAPEHISYLKISDGCSNGCSFCAIPLIKGPFREESMDKLVEEAKKLASDNVKELYVIAQDTTAYGLKSNGKRSIVTLLKQLDEIEGLRWIRLMYTYPNHITDELIEFLSGAKKVVPYIDVPLQHISDRVLKTMNRNYTARQARKLIEKLKKANITVRSTFIVGYPTEDEKDFEELCNFLKEYELDWVGFFPYYREENTRAYRLGDTSQQLKLERLERIEEIQNEIYSRKLSGMIGHRAIAMIDGKSDYAPGLLEGRMPSSAYDIDGKLFVKSDEQIHPGTLVRVIIEKPLNQTDLLAKLVSVK